jgi:hypothetical protein
MVPRLFLRLLLLLPLAAAAADDGALWQLQLRSSRHSDFGSLADLDTDDASRIQARGARNLAYIDDEARVQRSAGAWWLAILARQTATLTANGDAVDALRHAQKIGRDGTDRHWNVDARLRGFTGGGIELGRNLALAPEWSGLLLVQGLALSRWRDRHIEGAGDFRAATSTYGFDLRSTEINNRLRFPFQTDSGIRGAALLFGADLNWQRGDWTLSAAARDLGWLYWKGMPQQTFTLSSTTQTVDAEGFIVYKPLLEGRNSQRGLTQRAPARWSAAARWDATRDGHLTLAAEHVQDFGLLPSVAWAQPLGPVQAQLGWRFHERRLELGVAWGAWRLQVGTDRPGGDMHSRMFLVSYSRGLPF